MQDTSHREEKDAVLRVLSLYPNCGGLDLAFQGSEQFRVVRAIEADDSAAKTYEANIENVVVERGDPVCAYYELHEADIIVGTPPCPETATRSNFLTLLNAELTKDAEENCFKTLQDGVRSTTADGKKIRKKKPVSKRKRATPVSRFFSQIHAAPAVTSTATAKPVVMEPDPDEALRKIGSVVAKWPISVQLMPLGYPQWWCSYVYSTFDDGSSLSVSPPATLDAVDARKKRSKQVSPTLDVGNWSGSNISDDSVQSYDADTEMEGDGEDDEKEEQKEKRVSTTVPIGSAARIDSKPLNRVYYGEDNSENSDSSGLKEEGTLPTFSKAQRRKTPLLKRRGRTNSLKAREPVYDEDAIIHFLNAVAIVRPVAFVMILPPKVVENESFAPLYDAIIQKASIHNYRVESIVLDAREFGVAQIRRRAVIFGRNRQFDSGDTNTNDASTFFRKQTASCVQTTAGKVLRTLPKPGTSPNVGVCKARVVPVSNPERGLRGSAYAGQIFNGGGRPIDLNQPCNTFSRYIGGNFTPIVDQAHIENASVEPWYEKYYRTLKEKGAVSLGANGEVPERVRRLTVTEAKILTGFDVSFHLCGSHSAQFRQIGAACSPPVAESIVKYVEKTMRKLE